MSAPQSDLSELLALVAVLYPGVPGQVARLAAHPTWEAILARHPEAEPLRAAVVYLLGEPGVAALIQRQPATRTTFARLVNAVYVAGYLAGRGEGPPAAPPLAAPHA